jgi:tRNA(Ile)-lysidine synthase
VKSTSSRKKRVPIESPFTRATDTRVRRFIEERGVLRPGDRVLVAISGGQDSTALLLILSRLAGELGVTLAAGHFDHQLRDARESAEDRRFVEQMAGLVGVAIAFGGGDVARRAREQKETVEEAARNLRYQFLGSEARRVEAPVVAVGHTRDDRAETVLMHVVRGTGLDGLATMGERSAWPFGRGPDIVRPLVELSREETRRYCLESGVEPRDDPTNEMLIATRNRVRHEVMPALRSMNPRVDEALARLAEAAARDAEYVDATAAAAWAAEAVCEEGVVTLDRGRFLELPGAIAVRLVRLAAGHLCGPVPSQERVEQVLVAARAGRGKIELSGGIVVMVSRDRLTVSN